MPTQSLSLNELVMLLALDDEEGKLRWSVSPFLDYALAGAMLAELTLRESVVVAGEGDLKLRSIDAPTGSLLLDDVLASFRASDHPHTVTGWISATSAIKELDHRQMEELMAKGILAKREGHFLFIFPSTTYPAKDKSPEREIIHRIRSIVLAHADFDTRMAILITIAHGAHLLRGIFSDEELDAAQSRLAEIAQGRAIAGAAVELIQQAERALYVASSIPFMGISRF